MMDRVATRAVAYCARKSSEVLMLCLAAVAFSIWPFVQKNVGWGVCQACESLGVAPPLSMVQLEHAMPSVMRYVYWDKHVQVSEVLVLITCNCVMIVYSYFTFGKFRQLGSSYLLPCTAVLALFASFIVTGGILHVLNAATTLVISQALPFIFFVAGLESAVSMTRRVRRCVSECNKDVSFAGSDSELDLVTTKAVVSLSRAAAMDTFAKSLVLFFGALSGIPFMKDICRFGALFMVVHLLMNMTVFVSMLSIYSKRLQRRNHGGSKVPMKKSSCERSDLLVLADALTEAESSDLPSDNRLKALIIVFLFYLNAYTAWYNAQEPSSSGADVLPSQTDFESTMTQDSTLSSSMLCEDNVWCRSLMLSMALSQDPDQLEAIVLGFVWMLVVLLTVKYCFFDKEQVDDIDTESVISSPGHSKAPSLDLSSVQMKQTLHNVLLTVKECRREEDDSCHSRTEECWSRLQNDDQGPETLSDAEVLSLIGAKRIAPYSLEKILKDPMRAVRLRRQLLKSEINCAEMETIPFESYDYGKVAGQCCENVIGYIPIPVGIVGPLLIDGIPYTIPMATTEGCLVASTHRGSKVFAMAGGIACTVLADGMTRGPVIKCPSARMCASIRTWLESEAGFTMFKNAFNATSNYARLVNLHMAIAGKLLYIRIKATTGDAMGMNMISKGSEAALELLKDMFPEAEIVSVSGNYCTDKKPAAINWIQGRGKSVVAEAVVPGHLIQSVLKTTVDALVQVNLAKNLVGSAMAGSIGGFNAHAANIVTAIYIATGQDPAQNVESSNCITLMESCNDNQDLYISCTMPSIEVGTLGGGTQLPAQSACLSMLGVKGPHPERPGENAQTLAKIICGCVMAGELSLLSALAAGHLVKSHMKHNRK